MKKLYLSAALVALISTMNDAVSVNNSHHEDTFLNVAPSANAYPKFYEYTNYYAYTELRDVHDMPCYWDNQNNLITSLSDGIFQVYFSATNHTALYYPNGRIECYYSDGMRAVFQPQYLHFGLTQYIEPIHGNMSEFYMPPKFTPNPYPLDPNFHNRYVKPFCQQYPVDFKDNKNNTNKNNDHQKEKSDEDTKLKSDNIIDLMSNSSENIANTPPELPSIRTSNDVLPQNNNKKRKLTDSGMELENDGSQSPQKKHCPSEEKDEEDKPKWGNKNLNFLDLYIPNVINKISSIDMNIGSNDQASEQIEDETTSNTQSPLEESNTAKDTPWSKIVGQKACPNTPIAASENIIINKVFTFSNLGDEAKKFLNDILIYTSTKNDIALQNYIKKMGKNSSNKNFYNDEMNDANFKYFLEKANKLRHNYNNEDDVYLAESILKGLVANKMVPMPLKASAYVYLGKIKSHHSEFDAAIEIFQKGIQSSYENHARLYYFMGNNYERLADQFKNQGDENTASKTTKDAIDSWKMALSLVNKKIDREIYIKVRARLLYCREYHNNDIDIISKLYNELTDSISSTKCLDGNSNSLICQNSLELERIYKNIYYSVVTDVADFIINKNPTALATYCHTKAPAQIGFKMMNSLKGMHKKNLQRLN